MDVKPRKIEITGLRKRWLISSLSPILVVLLLVAGTSLVVYPVAGLVEYVRPGAKLVILNRDPTPYDSRADLGLRGGLVEELAHCVE